MLVGWMGIALISLALAGCASFFPSGPEGANVGVSLEDGVLSVIAPFCENAEVERIEVRYFDSGSAKPPVWVAQGYIGPVEDILVLSEEYWEVAEGEYDASRNIDIIVEHRGTDRTLGVALNQLQLNELEGDKFWGLIRSEGVAGV